MFALVHAEYNLHGVLEMSNYVKSLLYHMLLPTSKKTVGPTIKKYNTNKIIT